MPHPLEERQFSANSFCKLLDLSSRSLSGRQFSARTGGDSQVAIYDDCAGTTELACSEDAGVELLSDATLSVADGETVYIQIDGYGGDAFFDYAFFTCTTPTAPPVNDERTNATLISSLPFADTIDTSGATSAASDPSTSCGDTTYREQSASVWYAYTPAQDGLITMDTCGSDYDTVIEVWDGSGANLAPLSPAACNDEAVTCSPQSQLADILLSGGTTYCIEVMGYSNWGDGNLDLNVGFIPTSVELTRFEAKPIVNAIRLEWETATELDNLGFNLYRSRSPEGGYVQLNDALIPGHSPGSATGSTYSWVDRDVRPGVTYYYKLEDLDIYGFPTLHGPVQATVVGWIGKGRPIRQYAPPPVRIAPPPIDR
jgi:hypothetical protein